MKLTLRTAITKICFVMFLVRARILLFNAKILQQLSNLSEWIGQARANRKFEPYRKAADNFKKRSAALLSELQNIDGLAENRKQQVLARRSALLEEGKSLKTTIEKLAPVPYPGATAIIYVATRTKNKGERLQRRFNSLLRIISRVSNDNFYWDLLIWLVGGSEEMLGDLNEEYLLRISSSGEPAARAWYCEQAVSSARDYFWSKIERLAAIGALMDLVSRWFKK
jgi:hypothetical protein